MTSKKNAEKSLQWNCFQFWLVLQRMLDVLWQQLSNDECDESPLRQTQGGASFVAQTILRNNESCLVELLLSVTALAANFVHVWCRWLIQTGWHQQKQSSKPDAEKFLEAMVKEDYNHVWCQHWKVTSISKMISSGCKGEPIVRAWSLKRKHDPLDSSIWHSVVFLLAKQQL